jgi:hypothetical protein
MGPTAVCLQAVLGDLPALNSTWCGQRQVCKADVQPLTVDEHTLIKSGACGKINIFVAPSIPLDGTPSAQGAYPQSGGHNDNVQAFHD